MQNFKQPGKTLTFTAPSGGVVSGQPYLFGSILAVACVSVDAAAEFEGMVEGVFTLPKAGSQAWAVGQKIYWDDLAAGSGGQVCTSDATKGQLIGVATAVVGSGSGEVTGDVRLNGSAPATAEGPQTVIAALSMGTDVTASTANGSIEDSAAVNPTKVNFDTNCKEFAVKINEIIAALKAAGIVAAS